nr:SDR family NAD(P)-dependent oxidoreductase [Rubrivivax sp.]
RLAARGCAVERIGVGLAADEGALGERLRTLAAVDAPVAGVVHLAALGRPALALDAGVDEVRREVLAGQKSLHLVLHALSARLADGAHVLAASSLGGCFGRIGAAGADGRVALQGGATGLLKSLQEERPSLRTKAVDLDPASDSSAVAAILEGELELDGGRTEVGYPGGVRTVFRTVAREVEPAASDEDRGPCVVLATGGARGITAEVLRGIARPGMTLALTGRGVNIDDEPPALAACADAAALRRHFIAEVRRGALSLKPAEVEREVQRVLATREMRANVAALRGAGATVELHAVDVTDPEAMRALVEGLYARHGRIDGVVHGAGVIEDKRLADKGAESWSRVVDTKVVGLWLLQRWLRPASLRFFSVFSSVAGRYGNSGQSDYATANELMNRLCAQLSRAWGPSVNVHALCWGPWGPTSAGAGMVTAETEAKFAAKGVALVSAALGRRLFADELRRSPGGPVEVVCGQGPWEAHEAALGAIRIAELPAAQGSAAAPPDVAAPSLGPLLGAAARRAEPKGDQVVTLQLDARHRYLWEHVIDGTPVLPAAAAMEMLAEAAAALWPGWTLTEVRDFRLLKGIELKEPARRLEIVVSPPPYGSSEGFEVMATLSSAGPGGRPLPHYRATLRLEVVRPEGEPHRVAAYRDRTLEVSTAYGEWLFHGPRFQVIEAIDGLSPAGAAARVRATRPSQWMARCPGDGPGWCLEPALLDAAAQMAWLWARAYRDESALPARFGRVVRYRGDWPARLRMEYRRIATDDPALVRADVHFVDEGGRTLMSIEELDSIASPALNRLGGTARRAADLEA